MSNECVNECVNATLTINKLKTRIMQLKIDAIENKDILSKDSDDKSIHLNMPCSNESAKIILDTIRQFRKNQG